MAARQRARASAEPSHGATAGTSEASEARAGIEPSEGAWASEKVTKGSRERKARPWRTGDAWAKRHEPLQIMFGEVAS